MSKFKKGDKVRVIKDDGRFQAGDVLIVDEDDTMPYCIRLNDNEKCGVEEDNIELYTGPSWEHLSVGDIIIDEDDDEIKVLAVLPGVFLKSEYDNFDASNGWSTIIESQKRGWTLKGADDVQEMTVAEISKALGKTVKVVE